MTFMLANREKFAQTIRNSTRMTARTLPPFTSTERYLTLDKLQHMELQHWMGNFEDPLQDGRALVLHKKPNPVRPMLRQLLHNLHKVDAGEEVAPRKVGDEFNLLLQCLAIWIVDCAHHCVLFRVCDHIILWSTGLLRLGEIQEAVPEEAGRRRPSVDTDICQVEVSYL
jgi:hypothetical protein